MSPDLARAISEIVAQALNDGQPQACLPRLEALFAGEKDPCVRLAALATAPVYVLVAQQPGYPEDGRPGYLPLGADLKETVLNELSAMIEADFDKEEHRRAWEVIKASVAATPAADFAPGLAVNCPDDYLLTLDKVFASALLRQHNAMPAWHCQSPKAD